MIGCSTLPQLLKSSADLEMLREAVNFSRRILKGQPVKGLLQRYLRSPCLFRDLSYSSGEMPVELNPGAEQTTDEDIEGKSILDNFIADRTKSHNRIPQEIYWHSFP